MSPKKRRGEATDRRREGDQGAGGDPTQEGPVPGGSPRPMQEPQPIGDEPGARRRRRKQEAPPYEDRDVDYPES